MEEGQIVIAAKSSWRILVSEEKGMMDSIYYRIRMSDQIDIDGIKLLGA